MGKGLIKGKRAVGKWMQRFEEVRWKMHLNISRNGNALASTSAALPASGRRKQVGRGEKIAAHCTLICLL